jgi:hypothetical protein
MDTWGLSRLKSKDVTPNAIACTPEEEEVNNNVDVLMGQFL